MLADAVPGARPPGLKVALLLPNPSLDSPS
jgi:hypothetical protein